MSSYSFLSSKIGRVRVLSVIIYRVIKFSWKLYACNETEVSASCRCRLGASRIYSYVENNYTNEAVFFHKFSTSEPAGIYATHRQVQKIYILWLEDNANSPFRDFVRLLCKMQKNLFLTKLPISSVFFIFVCVHTKSINIIALLSSIEREEQAKKPMLILLYNQQQ